MRPHYDARPASIRYARSFPLVFGFGLLAGAVSIALSAEERQKDKEEKNFKRPSISVKVSPAISFSPARVVVTAELRGGAADDPDLYCPEVEWDWGDGTRSEATENCEPFEAGKSSIKRRWVISHTYTTQGTYRVQLRLKRENRTVAAGNTTLQVKAGIRDLSGPPFD